MGGSLTYPKIFLGGIGTTEDIEVLLATLRVRKSFSLYKISHSKFWFPQTKISFSENKEVSKWWCPNIGVLQIIHSHQQCKCLFSSL